MRMQMLARPDYRRMRLRKMRISSVLRALPDVELRWDEPLSRHTTFRVGGPVQCLARPRSEKALAILLNEVRERDIPLIVLGGGSNVLPPDGPLDAMVLQLNLSCNKLFRFHESGGGVTFLYSGAGVGLQEVLRYCLRGELEGLEPLAGIPGTVGGALVMNAGTPSGCISDILLWIDLVDEGGEKRRVPRDDLSPAYRSMGLREGVVVVGGCFSLKKGSGEAQRARVKEILERRKKIQPLSFPSAGSIFRNPPGHAAWELIEKAGMKGLRVGDAEVSHKHANWIINRGNARSSDIMELIRKIEKEVFGTFGVRLEREIRILGQS
ncbi:MAG: UDP-N-acetylmuramate dehydrogenase [Syntrophobacteraceae bacterium]